MNSEKDQRRTESLLETVDDLIFHMNDARVRFMILSFSSLIVAPVSIFVAILFIFHPLFLRVLLVRVPTVGIITSLYVTLTAIISAVWLYVGVKEYRFLSRWNNRFKRFVSLREQVDREIARDLKDNGE